MKQRDLNTVIDNMLLSVPDEWKILKMELSNVSEWKEISKLLDKYIPNPDQEWQKDLINIFIGRKK